MTLVKFNNGHKNRIANPLFNDVFNSILNETYFNDSLVNKTPAVNIAETDNQFHIELAAPGLSKEDFKINLEKDVLSVSAERKTEEVEGKKYSKKEYAYNSFIRSFTLPETADHSNIEAEYVDGVLKLAIAKKEEAKFRNREIAVK